MGPFSTRCHPKKESMTAAIERKYSTARASAEPCISTRSTRLKRETRRRPLEFYQSTIRRSAAAASDGRRDGRHVPRGRFLFENGPQSLRWSPRQSAPRKKVVGDDGTSSLANEVPERPEPACAKKIPPAAAIATAVDASRISAHRRSRDR